MGIYNEIQAVIVPYHRENKHLGKNVKRYFGIVLSYVRQRVIWTKFGNLFTATIQRNKFELLFLH